MGLLFRAGRREQIHVNVCLLARAYLWVNLIDLKHTVGENRRVLCGEGLGRG